MAKTKKNNQTNSNANKKNIPLKPPRQKRKNRRWQNKTKHEQDKVRQSLEELKKAEQVSGVPSPVNSVHKSETQYSSIISTGKRPKNMKRSLWKKVVKGKSNTSKL